LWNDFPGREGEVDLLEWYGNGDWPAGTTVHADPFGTAFDPIRKWPFNDPDYNLFPVLNLAIGGSGGGDPASGSYPAEMLIDWVRVF
jgi:hypothetical protein